MKSDRARQTWLIAVLLVAFVLVSDGIAQQEQAVFNVSYTSQVEPLPLNQIHSWILHVETTDGRPVEQAGIRVDGGMPAHGHGLPTQPSVREIGKGDYLVEGIKFSMTGYWEMWFEISADGVTAKRMFPVNF